MKFVAILLLLRILASDTLDIDPIDDINIPSHNCTNPLSPSPPCNEGNNGSNNNSNESESNNNNSNKSESNNNNSNESESTIDDSDSINKEGSKIETISSDDTTSKEKTEHKKGTGMCSEEEDDKKDHIEGPKLELFHKSCSDVLPQLTNKTKLPNKIGVGITVCLSIPTIWMNRYIATFYQDKAKTQIIAYLYLTLARYDVLVGINGLYQAFCLVLILLGYHKLDIFKYLLSGCYLLGCVAVRSSVFYNVVLAVVRSINIASPFYLLKTRWLKLFLFLYPLFWALIGAFDIWWWWFGKPGTIYGYIVNLEFLFYRQIAGMGVVKTMMNMTNSTDNEYMKIIYPTYIIPFVVPSVIAVICLAIQSYHLLRSSEAAKSSSNDQQKVQRNITITVTLLTMVFFVCNTTMSVYFSVHSVLTEYWKTNNMEKEFIKSQIVFLLSSSLILLNSFINPIILITRGAQLKSFLRTKFKFFGLAPIRDQSTASVKTLKSSIDC